TDLQAVQVLRLLRRLRPRKGEVLYLLIDDTRIAERSKKMAHLSKLYDHKTRPFITVHLVVAATWRYRGVTIPWQTRLWPPKGSAGPRYHKNTEIAADLVRAMPELPGRRVRVLSKRPRGPWKKKLAVVTHEVRLGSRPVCSTPRNSAGYRQR